LPQTVAISPGSRRAAAHSRDAGSGEAGYGFFFDAAPALTLGGALLAGGFAPWTNYAACALIGTAALKIGLAQSLNWRQDQKNQLGKAQGKKAPEKKAGTDSNLAAIGFPIASVAMAAAMGLLTLATFTFDTPPGVRSAAVIFTVAHVILGQGRAAPNAAVAILQAACGLIPLAFALALHWDWSAPVALASVASVALALVVRNRTYQQKIAVARDAESRMASALDSMNQSFATFDAGLCLMAGNNQFFRMFRLTPITAKEAPLEELLTKKLALKLKDPDIIERLIDAARTVIHNRLRNSIMVDLADERFMEFIFQPTQQGFSVLVEDVTNRRASELRIERMARQDDLTGLWNRSFYREKLEIAVARSQSDSTPFAVIVIDLDRFKQVNDSLGHPVGDKLLKRVAERLREMAASEDIVARLGGDEFAILKPGDRESAGEFAAKVVEMLSEPYRIEGAKLNIGASVGVAMMPDDGVNAGELMKSADMALYAAKDAGRGALRFYETGMADKARKKQQIEQDLRVGISRNELEVYYQPIVSFAKRRICCCEALVRWRHPVLGMISPGDFMPVAEESGLVGPLGEWVLRQACMDAKSWPKDVRLAVNFSALQFTRGNVVEMVRRALYDTKFPASRLEMEITESVLMNDADSVLASIDELREMGMRVALDDFGTGYSSLAYLSRFRPNKVKIDQSFVRDMSKNGASLAIIKAVKAMVTELGIDMLVEGVETLEQLEILREHGADEAQGYLFSKPRPANEIARFVADPAQLVRGRNLLTETNAQWAKGFERVNPSTVRALN
jgi:diguanylate cyclase (GGDEF)-like protein